MDSKRRQWQGEGTFFDGVSSRALPVQIRINEYGITVLTGDTERTYFARDFRVTERAGNAYARLELTASGGAGITLNNPEAIAALEANHFLKSNFLSGLSSKSKLLVLGGGFILAAALFFFFGMDLIIHHGLALVPKSTEEFLGRKALDTLVPPGALAADSSTLRILEKCAAVVAHFDTSQQYKITISIVEDRKTKNAFALPGGYICIYRGVLEIMDDESELFGLLAHEAGHIYLQHGLRRIARTAIVGFFFMVILGDASGLSAVLIDNSGMLLQLTYDRKEERAADDFAMQALRRSGLSQNGLITLFEKIAKEESDVQWLTYISTHPATTQRIEYLRQKVQPAAASKTVLSPTEWATLKGSKIPKSAH